MDQVDLDKRIKIARIDYDIGAYKAKILDEMRKKLEALLTMQKIDETIADFEQKILAKETERSEL